MQYTALGIDVAKSSFDAALLDETGKVRHKQFANRAAGFNELTAWLIKHQVSQVHVCLEATGTYAEALARFLYEAGHQVSLVNLARIHAYAQSQLSRNKTDKADAMLIARFCQSQQPAAWTPPAPQQRELQALARHLEALLNLRQQQTNRLESASLTAVVTASLETLIRCLDEQIAQLKGAIQQHIARHPELQQQHALLASIPGIGALTAAKLLAEAEHLGHYRNARQAAAYAGLTPRQHQSGSSIRGRTQMSKTGNSRLRKALYLPAIVAIRYNPIIRALAQRLREHHKSPMVIVGAAMRKLLHLAYGVLKTGKPFDAHYALQT